MHLTRMAARRKTSRMMPVTASMWIRASVLQQRNCNGMVKLEKLVSRHCIVDTNSASLRSWFRLLSSNCYHQKKRKILLQSYLFPKSKVLIVSLRPFSLKTRAADFLAKICCAKRYFAALSLKFVGFGFNFLRLYLVW